MNNPIESKDTIEARKKLKRIFSSQNYEIEEEVPLEMVTNNIGEEIWPPYQADMILTKEFVLELDSKKLHGTKIKRSKDRWRNKNIRNQIGLRTVRLFSTDIVKQSDDEILAEIEDQLKDPSQWE